MLKIYGIDVKVNGLKINLKIWVSIQLFWQSPQKMHCNVECFDKPTKTTNSTFQSSQLMFRGLIVVPIYWTYSQIKAINRQCFTCQRFGHFSKRCRNSGTKQVVVFVKRRSAEHKKEREQKRRTEFKSRRESAMEFPFYSVESRTKFEFGVNSLFPSSPANRTIIITGQ